jgi:hypothetical protein
LEERQGGPYTDQYEQQNDAGDIVAEVADGSAVEEHW